MSISYSSDFVHKLREEQRQTIDRIRSEHYALCRTKNEIIRGLEARVTELENALISIGEYWNQDPNEKAMYNALEYILGLVQQQLSKSNTST